MNKMKTDTETETEILREIELLRKKALEYSKEKGVTSATHSWLLSLAKQRQMLFKSEKLTLFTPVRNVNSEKNNQKR
ncbi:MAG: hypothetical protein COZ91_01870 [Candidatus Nealsonbacteria bacterium CG_4_8_14_3_um_filter_39_7]|nr:MAG: hypothetical protein COZ91_01870 [Candidatus Nealsonbacteria bacterium CG_4_8_14_3_um_filter_39_7]